MLFDNRLVNLACSFAGAAAAAIATSTTNLNPCPVPLVCRAPGSGTPSPTDSDYSAALKLAADPWLLRRRGKYSRLRIAMNETWHIPRPSLSGSSSSGDHSSNSSSKSHSNPSTVNRSSRYLRQAGRGGGHTNYAYVSAYDIYSDHSSGRVSRYPSGSYDNSEIHIHNQSSSPQSDPRVPSRRSKANYGRSSPANVNSNDKRGSRSSRGSTDSSSSSHSGASESLLLTAANLERFAAIQKKNQLAESAINDPKSRQNYRTNITNLSATSPDSHRGLGTVPETHIPRQQQLLSATSNNADAIIAIDPNLHFVKTKDVDSVSIASSTHFTMVNGIGRPPRKTKNGICSRSHQITVLILTMSTIFLVGILFAVYLLEMRARSMPR